MSKEIAIQEKKEVQGFKKTIFSFPLAQEMNQMMEVCKQLATCPFYQKLGAGGILAIYLTAKELNLPPMMCLNGGMYTFSGKVELSAQLMNMMIVNAGHSIQVKVLTEQECEILFIRSDGQKYTYIYNMKHAERAGLAHKDNWKKNPRDMLFSRCISGGGKKYMPDALMGCYAIGEIYDEDGTIVNPLPADIVIESESVQQASSSPKINEEQVKELEDLVSQCSEDYQNKLPKLLKKKGLDSLHDLPVENYEDMKSVIKEKAEANTLARKFLDKNNDVNPAEEIANGT